MMQLAHSAWQPGPLMRGADQRHFPVARTTHISIASALFSLLLLATTSLLDGCASSGGTTAATSVEQSVPKKAADLAKKGYLGAAIALLQKQQQETPGNSELSDMLAELNVQASLLEEDQLKRAQVLWDNNQLGAAVSELDVGLLTLPNSTRMQRRHAYFRELLDRRLLAHRDELMLTRARFVADTLRVQQEIFRLAPNESIGFNAITSLETERTQLAPRVLEVARKAQENHQYAQARAIFLLAAELGESEPAKQAIAEISQKEKQPKPASPPAKIVVAEDSEQVVLEAKKVQLSSQYQTAFGLKDWLTCQQTLTELRRLFPSDVLWSEWRNSLAPYIAQRVNVLKEDGLRRYRDGDIAGAKQSWSQAQALDPDNTDLPPLIERATRVLSNLKALSTSDQQK